MRNQEFKYPNAQKHGVFSKTAIVPGEDPKEFEELRSALVEEWMPAGASEEDAVLSIAKAIWRKRRVQKFLEIQLLKALRADPEIAAALTEGAALAIVPLLLDSGGPVRANLSLDAGLPQCHRRGSKGPWAHAFGISRERSAGEDRRARGIARDAYRHALNAHATPTNDAHSIECVIGFLRHPTCTLFLSI